MASFPTSVKTFAARSAGQTIGSAHVNDLQDEVNAIEDGLINGTAPISIASLTVAGGSTFTGSAVFSSRVRFSGQERCLLRRTTALELANNTFTAVPWDTEDADVGALHAANSTAVVIPSGSSGTYLITGMVEFNASSVGYRAVRISNAGNEIGGSRVQVAASSAFTCLQTQVVAVLNAADSITLEAAQQAGSTLSIGVNLNPKLTVARLY
jgi:hypothetical protein